MSRISQAAEKTRRAVHDLESYCRQLERLARRVSRIQLREDPDDAECEAVAPLYPAIAMLELVVAKLKDAAPAVPEPDVEPDATILELMSTDEPLDGDGGSHDLGFAETLTGVAFDEETDVEHPTESNGECGLRGTTPCLTVPTVLELLAAQRKTGTLVVETEHETFTIELDDGYIIHAVSDATPLGERLGSILLKKGMIGAEPLQAVLDDGHEGFLGAVLVRERLITQEELMDALKHQASLLFRRLFGHQKTEFRYYEGRDFNIDFHIQANVTMLLLEGARENDEHQVEPETDWADWLK